MAVNAALQMKCFLQIDLICLHFRKKSAETKKYLRYLFSFFICVPRVSFSLFLCSNYKSNYDFCRLVLLPSCCERVPNAIVHIEKITKYVLSGQKNMKFKNVSRNCFAFCLKALHDAVPSSLYLKGVKDLLKDLLYMPLFGNYFRYSIVGFCVHCKFRPKSQISQAAINLPAIKLIFVFNE